MKTEYQLPTNCLAKDVFVGEQMNQKQPRTKPRICLLLLAHWAIQ